MEFDYLPPIKGPEPLVGSRVRVPFRAATTDRSRGGLHRAIGCSDQQAAALQRGRSDESALLSDADLWLIRFVSEYYHHPIGEVVAAALPSHLRHGKSLHPMVERVIATDSAEQSDADSLARRAPKQAELLESLLDAGGDGLETDLLTELLPNWRRAAKGLLVKGLISTFETRAEAFDEHITGEKTPGPPLNSDQQSALSAFRSSDQFKPYLLDGVTGSGKTEVYLQRVNDVLQRGQAGASAGAGNRPDAAAGSATPGSPWRRTGVAALRAV